MSQVGIFPNTILPPGHVVETLTGDLGGAISPDGLNNINIITDLAIKGAGSTVLFSGAGNTVQLEVTDNVNNTIIGANSGNATLTGVSNTVLGANSALALTTGFSNTIVGQNAAPAIQSSVNNVIIGQETATDLVSGSANVIVGESSAINLVSGGSNVIIGADSGTAYTTNESSNIIIGRSNLGTVGESHVLRIGVATGVVNPGELNKSFIAGIRGITPDVNDGIPVYISSTGQLGTVGTAVGTTSFQTDIGVATPALGVLNILGGDGIEVSGAGNTVTVKSTGIFFTFIDVNVSPYVVLLQDVYLSVNSTGGAIIIQLPDVAISGEPYIIKDRTGTAAVNNITLTTVSGVTLIDGSTTFVMDSVYQSISLVGNGTTYEIY